MRTEKSSGTELRRGASLWIVGWRRFKRNKMSLLAMLLVGAVCVTAILAPWIAPYDPYDISAFLQGKSRKPPSGTHIFGTDRQGLDVFSRVVYGSRTALFVGIIAVLIMCLIAIPVGALAGFYGGPLDEILMRFTDSFLIVPRFLIILVLVKVFQVALANTPIGGMKGSGLLMITVILGLFGWPGLARLIRAEFLRIRELEFVESSRCLGCTNSHLILRTILPNCLPSIIVVSTLEIARSIMLESSISFLGFGDPTVVSWGQMLTFAQVVVKENWWLAFFPGIAIFATVLGFNLLGDALNDALNPRLR